MSLPPPITTSHTITSDSQSPTITPEPLARRLGLASLWLLVINGVIGAGIFGAPAETERLAGSFSPWVFALGAILIAPIMLCFAELASSFRGTGGPILYTRTAFGPFAGFQMGWAFYIARLTSIAANINLLITSISYLWPTPMGPATRLGLLFFLCAAIIWINIIGTTTVMRSLGILTILKMLPLIVLAIVGLTRLDAAAFTSITAPPNATDLGAAILLVFYAYVGFESGLVPGGESKNPQRDMPRALILALLIVTAIYILVQLAAQRLVPDLANQERPIVMAGEALAGHIGAVIVILAIIASVGGNLVGSMFSTPRITYRLALDAHLPPIFARVHRTHQTPWFSILFYGTAAFILAATGSFVWLAVVSVFTRLLIYMTCIASMPRVRAATAETDGRFKLPAGLTLPIIAFLICIALLTQVTRNSILATLALLAVGTALYALAMIRRPRAEQPQ